MVKKSYKNSGSKTKSYKTIETYNKSKKSKIIEKNTIVRKTCEIPDVLEFQICDWNSYHEIDGEDEDRYVIQLFGRTEDDKDVCLKVTGFTPFFYVEIPMNWSKISIDRFVDALKSKVAWNTQNNPNYDYDISQSLIKYSLAKKHKFHNFTNKKLFHFIILVFKSQTAMREFSNVLSRPLRINGEKTMLYQRYESNIEPHIRFMHINNLSSCGWVSIEKSKLKIDKDYSHCDISCSVDWRDVKPSTNHDRMAPLKIMGYDIECVSGDIGFPRADRKTDKIIQIGITMYRYGSMYCYEQHILTLNKCAKIKNAIVDCYKTEKGLIRAFAEKIRDIRPDFKAGYNNFGFDDKYIFDRIIRLDEAAAKKQGISVENLENKFMDEVLAIMGKVNNKYVMNTEGLRESLTIFEKKSLSSSAMGDNFLMFFQVPGIISIDMMKVIQREHRLIGYKLDNVSANFITEKAIKFKDTERSDSKFDVSIYTRSTKALEKNSYIQIMIDDGYSSSPLCEGAKYKVIDIETIKENKGDEEVTYQCIKTIIQNKDIEVLREIISNPLLKIYWTFAKDDIHYTLINKYFKGGDSKKIRKIAVYCLKDCKLVNLLLAKLDIIINSVGMAKVCHVPLSYLFLRGQGVKIFSLVSKKCKEKKFLIPVLRRKKQDVSGDDDDEDTYEGAAVITPKPAVYLSPIGVLDYSSLYPNSMRERNLTPECYVNDRQYDNLPGYKYYDVRIILKDKKGKILRNFDGTPKEEHHRFAQELDDVGNPIYGILPEILTELLDARERTKDALKKEKDAFIQLILNSLQLAYKITANSLYGQTGARTSPIRFITIAACTTAIGRERLHYAKKMVEDNFEGSEIIYGDSVTSDTPLILLNSNNEICIQTIETLGKHWTSYEQFKSEDSNRKCKQQSEVNYAIWTTDGWSKIKRVIRHKTVKKIFRIQTPSGSIDVTEDHSLLDQNKNKIKPGDCCIGTELYHGFVKTVYHRDNSISNKEAFIFGVFSKNGGCDNMWFIRSTEIDLLTVCKAYLEDIEKYNFKILFDPIKNIYTLKPTEKTTSLVKKYLSLFYPYKSKIVPHIILNSLLEIKQSFLDGYLAANNNQLSPHHCNIPTKIMAQTIFYLLKCLDYQVCIKNEISQNYQLIWARNLNISNSTAIKNKYFLGQSEEYVYDLETESGTFHAGIGELIVKNTDSIFINFHIRDHNGNELTDKTALIKTMDLSRQAATIINKNVPRPQKIVYEKTLHPLILITKKKYVGLLFENDPNSYYLKAMGIVLKRRDNAPIVKIVVGGIIDYILKNRDLDKAIEYTKEVLCKLMDGKYPIDKFIISKTLKAKYKKPSAIAHKVLADRMAIRDPGNKPQINDRIPFVYIVKDFGKKKKKDILQGDLVEHPDYVIEHDLQIDYLYYLEHQIINPTTQILELLMPTKDVIKMFDKYIIEEHNRRLHRQSLEKWVDDESDRNFIPIDENDQEKRNSNSDQEEQISQKAIKYSLSIKPKNPKPERNLPIYAGKKKNLSCQNLDRWVDRDPKENKNTDKFTGFVSAKRDKTDKDPIYAGKKVKFDCQSLDRWMMSTTSDNSNSDNMQFVTI